MKNVVGILSLIVGAILLFYIGAAVHPMVKNKIEYIIRGCDRENYYPDYVNNPYCEE